MRTVKPHTSKAGVITYKVRFRDAADTNTSRTFRLEADAHTFVAILDGGGLSAALEWLAARENAPTAWTVGGWWRHYLDQLTGITPRTRGDYEALHRRYFAHLDPLPLSGVQRGHVTTIVKTMEGRGLAPKTIKEAVYLLSTALQLAIDEGEGGLVKNPCKNVRINDNVLVDTEARFLTYEEFARLLSHVKPHYRPLVIWLFGTGMRWSEATALQGRHVKVAAGTARVERAWKRVPGAGWVIGPPKSKKARRTVNVATMALKAVKPLLRGDNELVFVTRSGGPVRHANFYNNVWRPAVKAAGLEARIHDARHTHASWLISDGISLEAVQDQLGHESILTTRKIYGHLLPALGVAVGRVASAALEKALPDGLESVLAIEAKPVGEPDE